MADSLSRDELEGIGARYRDPFDESDARRLLLHCRWLTCRLDSIREKVEES